MSLAGGRVLDAELVVSNADSPYTYKRLIDKAHRRKYTDERIDKMALSMGLVVVYFGTDRTYPDMAHHTILLGPRYKELLADIFHKKTLAEDFSLYLHAPTRTDPSLAPPGHENMYVLAPVPNLDSGTDWAEVGEAYQERLMTFLEETVAPDLRRHLVTTRMITPQHFHDELNSLKGAGFSVEPTLTQSAYFRPHNKSEDVEGLYFVGAGTHPGAGLPGVLCSAKVVDRLVPDLGTAGNPLDPIAGTHVR
ncbi:Phytoene desaturase (neurosporene-forming) [compost metagenome]